MGLEIGSIVEGTVSSVMKFGAFVDIGQGQSGLVHISEVSDEYVKDIDKFLKKGDKVKAVVIDNQEGKIALSIKKLKPKVVKPQEPEPEKKYKDLSFEEKLSKFMKESNTKYEQMRSRENSKYGRSKSRK
ncbi:S1 RNA binding domain protein [Peptoniphilus koenoeneniae]|uniref:S1 RNA binding domain protein n=1 Tax=Peptoniphilus koenoeneniae TaxID=507751 RepID=A0ABU0AS59_9FIRM|nr:MULTISPECIES: S1 RNA-binding domain-containing protein [Peptoniphilus]ERT56686.1 S1 RNA binding domain protein [Peptoniphilus sp. BV3C26]MDQ0274097.1 S1 RNA binding domain protein [Peptoniphilus koenoeneniae]